MAAERPILWGFYANLQGLGRQAFRDRGAASTQTALGTLVSTGASPEPHLTVWQAATARLQEAAEIELNISTAIEQVATLITQGDLLGVE